MLEMLNYQTHIKFIYCLNFNINLFLECIFQEKTLLENSSTDSSKLSKCDYYMVQLVKIPDYKTWLDVLIIKSQFDIFDEILSNLKVRLDKCEVLLTSESFPYFLRYVLEVGLFMNKVTYYKINYINR